MRATPAWTVTVVNRRNDAAPQATEAAVDRHSDDAALVAACAAGSREAFDLIVERYRRTVYAVCYRFAGNHEDASDLAQDAFVRAYRGIASFRGQSALSTWLYRVAVNVCLNRRAVARPVTESLDARPHVDHGGEPPDVSAERGQRAMHVRRAVARLPARQRLTVILRVYHDMSHEEIARVLGSSVGTVKANFFHALRNLEKRLRGGGVS
jgi:RNA polymerase sigma-70 factor (ECF subfamily)